MTFERGQVVLVLFPNTDLRTAKRRPVVVVRADAAQTELPQTVVAMITSNLSRAGHPSRVLFRFGSPEAQRAGLRTDSVVMADNLATIRFVEFDRIIGRFDSMNAIDDALRYALGL